MALSERASDHRPNNPRAIQIFALGTGAIGLEVIIYRQTLADLRPLVIVSSVDYPMPPSEAFCEQMWQAGLQVIFIRRPGFGGTPGLPKALLGEAEISNGAAVSAEAALLVQLLRRMVLKNTVLVGLGTSNPVCFRVAHLCQDVQLLVCANPIFNQNTIGVFQPAWFRTLLDLTMRTKSGVRIAEVGLKHQLRKDPLKFYQDVLEKCRGDSRYAQENQSDLLQASRLLLNVDAETFLYDVRMSLLPDPALSDSYFSDLNAVILSGEETSDAWKTQLNSESRRLALPIRYGSSGDIFVPYTSPQALLSLIDDYGAFAPNV